VVKSFVFVLPLLGTASCGLFSEEAARPSKVNDLVSWIERVHVESELSREKVHAAAGALRAIARQDFQSDALSAFKEFSRVIDQSERQAMKLRSTIEPMKAAASPVFEQWSNDLVSFTSSGMRQRSQARLDTTRAKYQSIVAAVEPAQSTLDSFNLGLRDIALFLGNDFNATSVTAIQDDALALAKLAADVDGRLEQSLIAAEEYVQSSALPTATPLGATPPGALINQPQPPGPRTQAPQPPAGVRPPAPRGAPAPKTQRQ